MQHEQFINDNLLYLIKSTAMVDELSQKLNSSHSMVHHHLQKLTKMDSQ